MFGQENALCLRPMPERVEGVWTISKMSVYELNERLSCHWSLVMVIQVPYIMLTEGQGYNFHGPKCNILKNNMHWGIFSGKEKHL